MTNHTNKIQSNNKINIKLNETGVKKVQKKEEIIPDLLGGGDDDGFNDFVSHRITPAETNNKITANDLFSNDISKMTSPQLQRTNSSNLDLLSMNMAPMTPNTTVSPVSIMSLMTKQPEVDLFSSDYNSPIIPSNTSNNLNQVNNNTAAPSNFDFFGGLSENTNKSMPSSMTMPNLLIPQNQQPSQMQPNNDLFSMSGSISNNNNNHNNINKKTEMPKSTSVWDTLGKSVDINLDNLLPHNKGIITKKQGNVPMNQLQNNKNHSLGSPFGK